MNSVVLDVAIGMSFVYLLLSLMASVVQEILATYMQLRSANLDRALRSLFSGATLPVTDAVVPAAGGAAAGSTAGVADELHPTLVEKIYDHGLVRGLYRDPDKDLAPEGKDWVTAPGQLLRGLGNQFRTFLRWTIGIRPGKAMGFLRDPMLLPAYIPSETFALALIDLLNPGKAVDGAALPAIIAGLGSDKVKAAQAIRTLAMASGGDLKVFQARLETWYNSAMDRASGWYKHYVQTILLGLGLVFAIVFNVDSIKVARTLWTGKDVRAAMVNAASDYEASNQTAPAPFDPSAAPAQTPDDMVKPLRDKLTAESTAFDEVASKSLLPVGWQVPLSTHWLNLWHAKSMAGVLWTKLSDFANWQLFLGWCITAMAISLGASFWFDTLNKFMIVRGTVKPAEKSKPEPSKS